MRHGTLRKGLKIPPNIEIIPLPPYTPEINPIEQIWAWLRLHGFRNEVLQRSKRLLTGFVKPFALYQ